MREPQTEPRILFLFVALLCTLATPCVQADELPLLTAALYAADDEAATKGEPYRAGRSALDDKRWADAAKHFAQSVQESSDHADAAHYWWAYALLKEGRSGEALEILANLRRDFRSSSWLDDARALQLEIQGGSAGSARDDDEELKLLALNGLMHTDSDRAMPMLKRFLAGGHSLELRERALFIVSQSDAAEARDILLAVARGDQHPELQERAVHYLGISDGPGARAALEEIYRSTDDKNLKEKVLHSFMITDAAGPLLELAKNEPDADLRRAAIHQLGVMDAKGSLHQLYETETSAEVKKQILHSLFIADDSTFLIQVARTESDENLRRSAVRSLGLVDSPAASQALVEIYGQSPDPETREAILKALFLSDDVEELIRVARTETDPQLRKSAFRHLSLMDDEAALEFMMEILEK